MAPFSPPQQDFTRRVNVSRSRDAPEQSDNPQLSPDSIVIPPALNTSPLLSLQQQSPEPSYYSSALPSPSSASRINAPPSDVMSTAYSLFVPPDPSWRRQVPLNLPSQLVQQPLTEPSLSLSQADFTSQQPGTYLPPSGMSVPTPIMPTQEHGQQQQQQQQQQRQLQPSPHLLSPSRPTDFQYTSLRRRSNEPANQSNTSARFQASLPSQTWSTTSRPASIITAPSQLTPQSYYSAASLIPSGYGLPPANQQPGVAGSDMSGIQVRPPSTQLSIAQSQSVPFYGARSNLINPPPEMQQPSLQQQSLGQAFAVGGSQQTAVFPPVESRSKMRRFR
ncbi:hypothetical protein V1509DRAFT_563184 [Lipomyces kononenkoae]